MKLGQLLLICDDDMVIEYLYKDAVAQCYKPKNVNKKKLDKAYRKVLKELREYPMSKKKEDITIEVDTDMEDNSKYIIVDGFKAKDKTRYAIDFMKWKQLINCNIRVTKDARDFLSGPKEADITNIVDNLTAEIIWEITFHGGSSREVEGKLNEIAKRAKEAMNECNRNKRKTRKT